jgi:site-specific DNA recombinase
VPPSPAPSSPAGYLRISDDREGRELGVDRQRTDLLELCAQRGWPEPVFYVDNDISASTRSKKRRPDFERMLTAAEAGDHDAIVFYTTSRLTRRPLEYERLIALVEARGTLLQSVRSGSVDLTTADGRMIARMLAAADAAEAERTGERVARAHEQRRAAGKAHGSGVQFGYRAGMVQHPAEAAAVRTAAGIVLSGGSIGDVIKAWDAAGVRPPKAAYWHWNVVRDILLRPALAGYVAHRREIVGDGDWQPILDRPTWDALCAALARRERRPGASARTHLLSGFLTCGRCGNYMSSRGVFYQCARERGGCSIKRNEAWLLDAVGDLVDGWLAKYDTGGDVAGVHDAAVRLSVEVAAAEEKIRELRARFDADEIDGEDFYPLLRSARERVNALKADQATVARDLVTVTASDARTVWRDGDLAARRLILERAVETIVVKPVGKIGRTPLTYDSLEVFWRT